MSGSGTLRDLHSGVLHKVGGRVKTWHKRWMIIRSDYSLYYFKDPNKAPQGNIPLKDTNFSVREGAKADTNWPKSCALENTLVLTTSTRTYYMYAESLEEAKEWKLQLEKAVERMRGEEDSGRRSIRKVSEQQQAGSGPCSAQAAKLQRPEAAVVDSRNNPKMYRKKDRRMPTKRFQADVDNDGSGSSDTDSEELKLAGLDGELDGTEYDPVPCSPLDDEQHESLYDLAGTSENDAVSPLNKNSSPPPRDARLSQASSSTDVHESLYDLVAMINADENTSETTTTPSKPPPVPQDTYEAMASPPPQEETYEAIDAPPSPTVLSQSVKTLPLPSIPTSSTSPSTSNAQTDLYEELDTPADSNLYEDIDKSERVEEAVSDEEGDIPIRTPAPGPPLPSRDPVPPIPPKDSTPPPIIPPRSAPAPEEQTNVPTLPPKPEETPAASPYRSPPEIPTNSSSGEASGSPKKTADGREPALAAPAENDQEGEDIYDDTLAITKPPEQAHSQDNSLQEEGEVYDDIEGVMQQNIVRTDSKEKEEAREEPEVATSVSPPENHITEEPAVLVNGTQQSSPPPPDQTRLGDSSSPKSERMSGGSACSTPSSQGSPRRRQLRDSLTPTGSPQVAPKSKTLPQPSPRTLKGESGKGVSLFQRRAQEVDQCAEEFESKQRVRSMLLMEPKDSSSISTDERVVIAETLREVEQEKLMAHEEKFRWERERLKMEKEMKKLEEEKRLLQAQLEQAHAKLNQN